MKVGVMMALFGNQSLKKALDNVTKLGIDTVEICTGAYPGDGHCKPDILLKNKKYQPLKILPAEKF